MKRTLAIHSLSGHRSNNSILRRFIHLQYNIGLKLDSKWTLADHSLNQLFALGDYVTFRRFLEQRRTLDLNNNLHLTPL